MNGESSPVLDLRAVGRGTLWGLAGMLVGSVIQGIYGHSSPMALATEQILTMVWQAAAGLLGGFLAARRAPGAGWLHGAAAGLGIVALLTLFNGIAYSLPDAMVLLKAAGLTAGAGLLGGIAGVNTRH